MKIAIAGKGGVGKTTLASLLALHYARRGRPVLAIDADPSPCLGPALGFPDRELLALAPIADMQELIAERTGAAASGPGAFFKLNPRVEDLPDRFSRSREGIRLLLLGAVQEGGAGCICPASALLKELVRHVVLRRTEVVLLDLYAGVEHLGRATAEAVDAIVAVAEPTVRSLRTVRQVRALAEDLGVHTLWLVGNKVRGDPDRRFLEEGSPMPVAGFLPHADEVAIADREGRLLYDLAPALAAAVAGIAARLEGACSDRGTEGGACANAAAAVR